MTPQAQLVQFSRSVVSDSLRPHESQHARPPCPSPTLEFTQTLLFIQTQTVHCSMSSSNCCFLTCIQVSQEADQVVWYSHLLKNLPQFIGIHTVKGFGIVNKAVGVFLELSCFFDDPVDVGNLTSGSFAFLHPA